MGDSSKYMHEDGPACGAYESPESRRLGELDARLGALEAEVERLRQYAEGRAQEQQEAYRRMMVALSGASVVGGDR